MDQGSSTLMHLHYDLNEPNEVLIISSNSSICSDFCGFKEFSEMALKQKSKYIKELKDANAENKSGVDKQSETKSEPAAPNSEAKKRFFVNEMDLLPAEEIFEINSNSTTDTLRRQRIERNNELRLKEVYLCSRNPNNRNSKSSTFQRMRTEDNSESSSEFPASSPSNTQLHKRTQQSQRPPLLKNTLPADAFERGLALIAAQNPPMSVIDKIGNWQCANVDEYSDVEDVVSFEEGFKARECNTKRLPTRSKTLCSNQKYKAYSDFRQQIASMRAPEPSLRGSNSQQNSKFTSEDDEKPTTSNCPPRNRDTPLKKRTSKYKRAADLQNESNIPKKKSSSSGTPKNETQNNKKKNQQQKRSAATAAGDDAIKTSAENSSSSHAQNKTESKSPSLKKLKPKQAKIVETNAIAPDLCNTVKLTATPTEEDQEAFFRWRRLSREIDKSNRLKTSSENCNLTPPNQSTALIQIRYDFMDTKRSDQESEAKNKTNAYSVVVKPLTKDENKINKNNNDANFKASFDIQSLNKVNANTSASIENESVTELKEKTDVKANHRNNIDSITSNTASSSMEFHQQHEFCNYLGLTGMSTANAMATAAAELSKCNVARRSLRVRKLEMFNAKASKEKSAQSKKKKITMEREYEGSENENPTLVMPKEEEETPSETMENSSPALCAENLDTKPLQINNDIGISTLTPSEQLMQQTKEREAKIQILCQITASSKEEEEEACKKCVEQITEPIRRTLLEQCKQSGDGPKATTISKSMETCKIEKTHHENDKTTKFIDLTPKSAAKTEEVGKVEIQTLHEKVQKCLEEARQNAPNIFIVKSLDSLRNVKDEEDKNIKAVHSQDEKISENTENLNLENLFDEVAEEEKPIKLTTPNLRSKAHLRNNKATQVSAAEGGKGKKRKQRTAAIRKTNSNLSGTRRLYTRSMLNLNQQRELRNRKVILKLLKTYSGLRIKVSQPKKKANPQSTELIDFGKGINNPNENEEEHETSIELAVSSEDTTVGDTKTSAVKTLFLNRLSESSSTNAIRGDTSSVEELVSIIEDAQVHTTHETPAKKKSCETKNIFEYENLFVADGDNMAAASSRTLTPKCMISTETFDSLNHNDKLADAAVQTDLANIKTILQPLCLADIAGSPAVPQHKNKNKIRDNCDTDVVSSSDVVTSTTCHIGEHNRAAPNLPSTSNLVTKELYRNFSFTAESNVAADAAPSQTSTASQLFTEINPLANASLNSSAININDLGIHALSEPSRALRNPLKMSDGQVLYMYYEDSLLIVVQETLISFWKYSRILNALTVKPHEVKCANSCNSRDLGTEELQSSAATMGFHSSDLEHMSSMLVSGCEWFYLGERKRLTNDIEIESPYISRLCFNDSRPVYVEMRCRELLNDFRECNLLSCYVNVYFFNEEEQVPCFHSIQLDSIQSAPIDVIYTTILDSRYFVLAWPQANVLGKVRSGVCKYALTPELDMLATTRDFKAMRHALRSLECLKDGKLLGFGDSQLTVWDHRSGDVLMNYDLSMPLGRNLGTIYYQGLEEGQDNVVIMLQNVRSEASSDLVVIACTISHTNPSRRVLQRHRLPTPAFYNIRRGVNNGEHFVITSNTDEEIWINCNDPRQLMFIPAQRSQRFYSSNRSTLVELTNQTLTVDTFSNYLLKIAAGINSCKKKLSQAVTESKPSWTY